MASEIGRFAEPGPQDVKVAVGRPETFTQAFYARDLAGTVVLVGVPTPDMRVELPLIDVFGRGGATKSSWYEPEHLRHLLLDQIVDDDLGAVEHVTRHRFTISLQLNSLPRLGLRGRRRAQTYFS